MVQHLFAWRYWVDILDSQMAAWSGSAQEKPLASGCGQAYYFSPFLPSFRLYGDDSRPWRPNELKLLQA